MSERFPTTFLVACDNVYARPAVRSRRPLIWRPNRLTTTKPATTNTVAVRNLRSPSLE